MTLRSKIRGSARVAFLFAAFGLAAILILVVFFLLMPRYRVSSASMEKTLHMGEFVLVERFTTILGAELHRGEVVVYRWPPNPREMYLHRIVAVPGDRLHLRDKRLFLNGVETDEPYAQHVSSYADEYRDNFPQPVPDQFPTLTRQRVLDMLQHVSDGELVIPKDCYFVMGDNRDDALDSRYSGFIHRADVIGIAVLGYGSRGVKPVGKSGK